MQPYILSSPSFLPPGTHGPLVGWVFCVGVLGLGLGSVIVHLLLRVRTYQKEQAREQTLLREGAAKALIPGAGRAVKGRVDLDGGEDVVIDIAIRQVVKNYGWGVAADTSHSWTEVSRTVRAVPFYLVREDGQSVYVEPSETALVVDALETKYPIDLPGERIRTADVRRGETILAYGDLVEGTHPRAGETYRDGTGWTLRAPRAGRMLLATEVLHDRYARRISFLRRSGLGLGLAFCVLHAFFTVPFVAASLFGTHTTAEITGLSSHLTDPRTVGRNEYVLTARTVDGFTLKEHLFPAAYREAKSAKDRGDVLVPLLRTGRWEGASFLGEEPYVYALWDVLGVPCAAMALLLLWLAYPKTVAWYDHEKLGGLSERSVGHWRETRPGTPIKAGT